MEFINPEAFSVQYKSRYVPKPVETIAAMTDTFNKRYEDAMASYDILKQAAMAAKPETTAQLSDLEKIASEYRAKIDAAIESKDPRQVDIIAKSAATAFAADPRIGIIAKGAEQVRKANETRIADQLTTGARYFQNVDDDYNPIGDDNYLGYSVGEDGKLQAVQYVSPYVKGMDWVKAAKFDLTADQRETLAISARGGDDNAQAVLNASDALMQVQRGGIDAEKIANISKQYADVFLSTPEGRQYIAMVRSRQQPAPEGIEPNNLTDNELAAVYLAKVNAPQQFSKESISYIIGKGGGGGADEIQGSLDYIKGQKYILGKTKGNEDPDTAHILRMAKINTLNIPEHIRGALKIVAAITKYMPTGDTSPNQKPKPLRDQLDENSKDVYDAIVSFSDLDPNSKGIEEYVKSVAEGSASATNFVMFANSKKINNETAVHFTNDGYLKKKGTLRKVGDSQIIDPNKIQAELNKEKGNKPEVIGRAESGTDLSFYGGAVIQSGEDVYVLEPNKQEQATLYNKAKVNMISNVVDRAVKGELPYMKHNLGDKHIKVLARKEGNDIFVDVDESGKKSKFKLVINSNGSAQYVKVG